MMGVRSGSGIQIRRRGTATTAPLSVAPTAIASPAHSFPSGLPLVDIRSTLPFSTDRESLLYSLFDSVSLQEDGINSDLGLGFDTFSWRGIIDDDIYSILNDEIIAPMESAGSPMPFSNLADLDWMGRRWTLSYYYEDSGNSGYYPRFCLTDPSGLRFIMTIEDRDVFDLGKDFHGTDRGKWRALGRVPDPGEKEVIELIRMIEHSVEVWLDSL